MRTAAWAVAASVTIALLPATGDAARRADSGVVWLFLVDDLHIDFRTTGIVRAWLVSLVRQVIQDEDIFAMRTTGPSSVSVGLLADAADLAAGMRRVSGSGLTAHEVRQVPEGVVETLYRARIALQAATEFVATIPAHDPRRRVMVYIGKGFDVGEPLGDETQKLLNEAWRFDVTLLALDPSALPKAQALVPYLPVADRVRALNARRSSLEAFTLPTNGFVLADDVSVTDAAKRISSAVRHP